MNKYQILLLMFCLHNKQYVSQTGLILSDNEFSIHP